THDALHLLRHTIHTAAQEIFRSAELRRFSLCERRVCNALRRIRSGRTAGLVAVRTLHGLVRSRRVPPALCPDAATAQPESARGSALPGPVEHYSAGSRADCFSV